MFLIEYHLTSNWSLYFPFWYDEDLGLYPLLDSLELKPQLKNLCYVFHVRYVLFVTIQPEIIDIFEKETLSGTILLFSLGLTFFHKLFVFRLFTSHRFILVLWHIEFYRLLFKVWKFGGFTSRKLHHLQKESK